MKFNILYCNKIIGFLIGKHNIKSETKKILNKDEEYISGIEITKFNESIYIFSKLILCLSIILSFYSIFLYFS